MEASNGKNRTEAAYQKIKGFILRSEIYPRQKIVIEDLARQMGVSRTPIREAMNRLVNEGYVTHVWNRGFSVKEITAEEVEELYGAREALEPYLAEEAARRVTKRGVQDLERLLKEYGEFVDRRPRRQRRLVDLDFHDKVGEIAGNSYLQNILREVFERIVLKQRIPGGQLDRGRAAWMQHRAILAAIRDGNAKEARRAALYHVQKSKQLAMLRLHEEAEYLKQLSVVG
jgi:DNA-binding GntR family transcriptional regulator